MKDEDYVEKINKTIEKYIVKGGHELLEEAEQLLKEMKVNKKALADN